MKRTISRGNMHDINEEDDINEAPENTKTCTTIMRRTTLMSPPTTKTCTTFMRMKIPRGNMTKDDNKNELNNNEEDFPQEGS